VATAAVEAIVVVVADVQPFLAADAESDNVAEGCAASSVVVTTGVVVLALKY
jgi:hypothetical protein